MKITLGASELAPGGAESVESFKIDGREVVQAEPVVRAAAIVPFARGNSLHTIAFRVERTHATAQAAQAFVANHHATLVKSGTLTIIAQSNVGSGTTNTVFAAAAIETHSGWFLGARTFHEYVVIAGGVS